ncbi:MAG: 37S ribosomal protein S9, mitochondrial [Geoglossum umbratile]|nr:MAG: 37S ribosomal protein S9, mitochondrial [Geoglossum umbratile]
MQLSVLQLSPPSLYPTTSSRLVGMRAAWPPKVLRFGFRPLSSWVSFSQQTLWRPYVALLSVIRGSHRGTAIETRQFVSSSKRSGIAAPEIRFGSKDGQGDIPGYARIIPASPSYFTGKPDFTDNLITLQDLLRKYQTLPVVQPGQAPRVAWKTLAQYRLLVGEPVKAAKYHKIILLLQRLNHIHPSLLPGDVELAMAPYKRDVNPHENVANQRKIDHFGRAIGIGRRKSSTARVWLVEGDGEVLVNGKPLTSAFSRIHDRESAIWALKATGRIDKYNVWALVAGGGMTGQAEAMTLAVAKALLVHEPLLKPALRRAGCITRDPRRVERKKPGKLKARKMPAWVKR